MDELNENPLFDADLSDAGSASSSSDPDAGESYTAEVAAFTATPPTSAVLQTVNIKSHVPVVLELTEPNYPEWRTFFDAFIGKFGLGDHLSSPPTATQRRNAEWRLVDQCILSWLYNSIAKDVLAIVRVPKPTAYVIWHGIQEQFRDNQLHRAVYLEAEFRNLVQGDMDIATYTGRLKRLSDSLRDVGQAVGETSQVLNLLRGLNSKYRHAIPAITARQPHTNANPRKASSDEKLQMDLLFWSTCQRATAA